MPDVTPNLKFGYLFEGEKKAELAINDVLNMLDFLIDTAVEDEQTAPPGTPVDGEGYLINGTPTGTWLTDGAAQNDIAFYYGGWIYYTPKEGKKISVKDINTKKIFTGSAWVADDNDTY